MVKLQREKVFKNFVHCCRHLFSCGFCWNCWYSLSVHIIVFYRLLCIIWFHVPWMWIPYWSWGQVSGSLGPYLAWYLFCMLSKYKNHIMSHVWRNVQEVVRSEKIRTSQAGRAKRPASNPAFCSPHVLMKGPQADYECNCSFSLTRVWRSSNVQAIVF